MKVLVLVVIVVLSVIDLQICRTVMGSNELSKILEKHAIIHESDDGSIPQSMQVFNPYTMFKEFSRKQIQDFQKTFNKYDSDKDRLIDFDELKRMMETIGAPQTHLSLKAMIQEVDEDYDDNMSFREFLWMISKAKAGEINPLNGLTDLYQRITETDIDAQTV